MYITNLKLDLVLDLLSVESEEQFVSRTTPPVLCATEPRGRSIVPHEKCVFCFSEKSLS